MTAPQLFYPRRIGRMPRGSLPSHDFVKAPDGTRILGAAKVTGKLPGGVSVGSIHAATARETASLQHGSDRFDAEVRRSSAEVLADESDTFALCQNSSKVLPIFGGDLFRKKIVRGAFGCLHRVIEVM